MSRNRRPGTGARLALRPLAATALLLALATGTAGQVADSSRALPASRLSPADSADLLDEARDAQRRFESVRRRHLPLVFGGGSGPCDDQVGRMCWRHDTGGLWTPEPEDGMVTRAREVLLADLARIGAVIPGDGWVLGQRVWYLLEAERTRAALELARACGGGAPWWCAALEGLALHVEGRYADAEEAFDRARGGMDSDAAREWEDVESLLDGDARGDLNRAGEDSPEAGDAWLERFWRLSDPLYLVPGNERRTAHGARRTVSRIRSEARNPHNISWGDDLAELLVRYGWGVGWERVSPDPARMGDMGSVIGHEHPESRSFIVPGDALRKPASAATEDLVPRLAYAPSAYAPAYAPLFLPMEAKVAVLHRGATVRVGVTFALPPDTTRRTREARRSEHRPPPAFQDAPVQAGLFLVSAGGDTVHARQAFDTSRGALDLEVPAGDYWLSVEVLDPARGRAGRFRRGLEVPPIPPDLARLSDLLLQEPDSLPTSADEALARLSPTDSVRSGEALVLAWELGGLGWREEVVAYRLSLEEAGGGLLRSVGEALGLMGRDRPLRLEWEEEGPDRPGPVLRSIRVDIPPVEPGSYRLRLEVATPGRTEMASEQVLWVGPAEDRGGGP